MKTFVAVGILLLLSGPLLIGGVYALNRPLFVSELQFPGLFIGISAGLLILALVSLAISSVPLKPREAAAIGVAFVLVPVAVFGFLVTVGPPCGCTTSADVSAATVSLSHGLSGSNLTAYCSGSVPSVGSSYIELDNTGSAATNVYRLDVSYGGITQSLEFPSNYYDAACPIAANSSEYVVITHSGFSIATKGESFNGSVGLTNGAIARFSGFFL